MRRPRHGATGDRTEVRGGSQIALLSAEARGLAARSLRVDLLSELAELAECGLGEEAAQLQRIQPVQRAVRLCIGAQQGSIDQVPDPGELLHIGPPGALADSFCTTGLQLAVRSTEHADG